jgi:guanylate kinase
MLKLAPPDSGVLLIVSGPSGAGKSTLLQAAMKRIPNLSFSVSATTRPMREGEREGVDYHFIDPDSFEALAHQGALLEHATVYAHAYGTLAASVEEALSVGRSILLDIDVQGARQVRDKRKDTVSVFVLPPSMTVLEQRLRARGTDDEATIALRMVEAREQLLGAQEYDYWVLNDDREAAQVILQGIILAELSRAALRQSVLRQVL